MSTVSERRRACRYRCAGQCTVGYMDGQKMTCHDAKILDVSTGGMQIWCSAKRPVESVVMIKCSGFEPLYAQVMRCSMAARSGYNLGLKFVDGNLPLALFTKLAFPETPDCLKQLGLSMPCTVAEVKQAYRSRAKAVHPDYGGSDEAFRRLRAAYADALQILDGA